MRKSRFVALIMVVAIMLMGAGYAQWTDLLTVDATICTGDMNVEFTDEGGGVGAWVWCNGTISAWATTTYSSLEKIETVGFGNIYPGAQLQYNTKLKNTGTIPVELEQVMIEPAEWSECNLDEYLVGWVRVKVLHEIGNTTIVVPKTTGIRFADLPCFLVENLKDEVLLESDILFIEMFFELPCSVENIDNLEGKCCDFTVQFGFGQATCDCPEGGIDSYSSNTYPSVQ